MDEQERNERIDADAEGKENAPAPNGGAATRQPAKEDGSIRLPNLFWALVPISSMVGLML